MAHGILAVSWSTAALIAAAVVVAFLILLFAVALGEKRLTQPYVLAPADSPIEVPPYVAIMSQGLVASGFVYGGVVAHAKYPSIKVLGTIWMSANRDTIAICGSGKVMNMQARQTWLITPLGDGTFLVTTDQNDEGDHSRTMRTRRRKNARIDKLLSLHRSRVDQRLTEIRSFTEPTIFEAVLGFYAYRTQCLVNLGRAKWLDAAQQRWRYTIRGAMLVCGNFFAQLGAALAQMWRFYVPAVGAAVSPAHDRELQELLGQLRSRLPTRPTGREHTMIPRGRSSPKPRLNRRIYLRALARMSPSQRLLKAFELSEMSKRLLKEGLSRRFPDKSEAQLHAIYLKRLSKCHNRNC